MHRDIVSLQSLRVSIKGEAGVGLPLHIILKPASHQVVLIEEQFSTFQVRSYFNILQPINGGRQILSRASDAALKEDDLDLIALIGINSETIEISSGRALEQWNSEAIEEHVPKWA